ncbi:copper resistance protein CopC [Aquipuribacter sp. MA13-6]|uniref:copper resistance CopC family protein n=1 Tax=unclassified Aquipuribacter TaxID=2635084 RepID=UPI003EEC5551
MRTTAGTTPTSPAIPSTAIPTTARRTPRPGAVAGALLVALVATATAVATASPASAHARFLGSDPEEGAVVQALPDAVVMTYDEAIAPQFVDTAVVPPGGDPVVAESTAVGTDVIVDLAATVGLVDVVSTGGEWQVVARVVSVDGHPVEHTTRFVLEPPAVLEPSVAAQPTAVPEVPEAPEVPQPTTAGPTTAGPTTAGPTTAGPATVSTDASSAPTTIAADPASDPSTGRPGRAVVVGVVVLAVVLVGGAAAYRRARAASG